MSIVNLLRPYDTDTLISLGNTHDGGYVVSKNHLDITNPLYTYGVGSELSFERDLLKLHPSYKIHLYDHTIASFPHLDGDIHYHKEGLAKNKTSDCDTFFNHLKINGDENSLLFLKLDVEGAEFDFFNSIEFSSLSNVVQMMVEFHLFDNTKISSFSNIIKNLNELFYTVHIHGNNFARIITFENEEFPEVPEVTFINKKFIPNIPGYCYGKYPINNLDFPNGGSQKQWEFEYK